MVQAAEPLSTRSRNCRGFDGVGERQFSSFKQELLTTDEVELAVETAYNKLERTQEMLRVSEEVLALLSESSRVQQELLQGAALKSQAAMAAAQEYDGRRPFCNHIWTIRKRRTSLFMRWAAHQNDSLAFRNTHAAVMA